MSEAVRRPLQPDSATITAVVRRALLTDAAQLRSWDIVGLTPGAGSATAGIARVSGLAEVNGRLTDWSIILKTLVPGPPAADPTSWNYREREALLYDSGLLEELAGDLRAPRCFGVQQQPDGVTWLWLEDVTEAHVAGWSIERFGQAAYHLGRMNGAYLVDRPLPSYPWLSRNTLRSWTSQFVPWHAQLAEAEEHPLIGPFCDPSLNAGARRLARDREEVLTALARLPQTFQHGDAHKRNLFARVRADGEEETVAIDWAFAGIRAVGEEVESLVSGASMFFEIDHADIDRLSQTCFEGYVSGLRDAGWAGDSALARLGYLGAATLRYSLVPIEVLFMDGDTRDWFSAITGQTFEETILRYQAVRRWGLAQEAEMRALMRRLL